MIGIVNYGLGNVQAFLNIYRKLNIACCIISHPAEVARADKLVLPGVGAFDWAMRRLNDSGLRPSLSEAVIGKGVPVLGVCVGMQILAVKSEEGSLQGLGWIDGEVRRLPADFGGQKLQLPHMGWNDVRPINDDTLFKGSGSGWRFYFLHSYFFYFSRSEDIAAFTDYGIEFACAIRSRNIFGVQFHPEKSHAWGIQLLKNFAEL
mgnify:CR=1 FL=1